MITLERNKNKIKWRQINMRNINHLLGVEFLHDLYNRYLPNINSVRFRNTIVIWKNKIARSFAPEKEWQLLEKYLGERFYRLEPTLLKEVRKLVKTEPNFLKNFLRKFPENLSLLSNIELGLLLLNLHYFVLGELYRVNLVQLEHALTWAILKALNKYEQNEGERKKLLSRLIISPELTEFQKEKMAFLKIIKLGQRLKAENPSINKKVYQYLKNHYDKYAFLNCAYGETSREFRFFIERYKELYFKKIKICSISKKIKEEYKERQKVLRKIRDQKIRVLTNLLTKLGIFRDKNKAALGRTIKYRLMILDEIARRKLETRDALNYYLLSEILDLLSNGKRLKKAAIKSRKKNGITIYRTEYLTEGIPSFISSNMRQKIKKKCLKGICASPGVTVGRCKIVISKQDIQKIKKNDIMVAIGTDFDLLEGIYKARGVITEEGGILSHAAVVCREIKKPCCIGVKNATTLLEGKKVKLNASEGVIKIF